MRIFIKTIILSTILSSSVAMVHAWGIASGDVDRVLSHDAKQRQKDVMARNAAKAQKRFEHAMRLQSQTKNHKFRKDLIRKALRNRSK